MRLLHGLRIKNALLAGIDWFGHFRKEVDQANVFPVPDGDTGKNMHHAFQAARREITAASGKSASEVVWAAARGSLLGSRGCSGMILSGFFAGFAEGVGDRKNLTAQDLAQAFQIGCLRARERVEHPVEGTILSVGEAAARSALEAAAKSANLLEVMVSTWKGALTALQDTPKHLKILKESQVLDAGGMGLVYFLEGMVRFNFRQSLEAAAASESMPAFKSQAKMPAHFHQVSPHEFCTEFIIQGQGLTRKALHELLQPLGEELMIAAAESGLYKVHLHAKDPEAVLHSVARLGKITWQKVDDMAKQHRHAFGLDNS